MIITHTQTNMKHTHYTVCKITKNLKQWFILFWHKKRSLKHLIAVCDITQD